jgi:hypothetical protein
MNFKNKEIVISREQFSKIKANYWNNTKKRVNLNKHYFEGVDTADFMEHFSNETLDDLKLCNATERYLIMWNKNKTIKYTIMPNESNY